MDDDILDAQIAQIRVSGEAYWRREAAERGVRGAWPDLVKESGSNANALRHLTRSVGTYVGPVWDPDTEKPGGSSVVASNLSKVISGAPNQGKSTRGVVPGATQDIAAGKRVLLVTPQPKTFTDMYQSALALGDSDTLRILDFGGQIVEHASNRLTTWDPTTRCIDPTAAAEFAEKLTGEGSKIGRDLGQGRGAGYWLQIPGAVTAAAAHLTAVERRMRYENALRRGLTPEQARVASLPKTDPRDPDPARKAASGIGRVFYYTRRAAPPDPAREGTPFAGLSSELRSELTQMQRQRLSDSPKALAEMEEIVRQAAYNAAQYELPLQKIVYNRALLQLQGAPVNQHLAGAEIEEINDILVDNVSGRDENPLSQLDRAVRLAVPPPEQRILSPQRGDMETSPAEVVNGPSGLTLVSYDSSGSPGLAAGWFCDEVIKAGFRESKALAQERLLGGTEEFPGVAAWVDEGGALKYVDFAHAMKEGRQHNMSVNVATTSVEQLEEEIGEARAKTVINSAPVFINFSPNPEQAEQISESFGKKLVDDPKYSFTSGQAGYNVDISQREVPRVPVDRIRNLKPGEAVVTDTSGEERRDQIVRPWAFYEKDNPVGDTMAEIASKSGPDLPWKELLPDAQRRLDDKLAAKEALHPQAAPGALRRLDEAVQSGPEPSGRPDAPKPPAGRPAQSPAREPSRTADPKAPGEQEVQRPEPPRPPKPTRDPGKRDRDPSDL